MVETPMMLFIGTVFGYVLRSIPDWLTASEKREADADERRSLKAELEALKQKAKDEGRFVPDLFNKA